MLALAFAALLWMCSDAGAQSASDANEPVRSWVIGVKAAQVTAFEPGHGEKHNETVAAFGGGIFVERTIAPWGIDLGLSAVAAADHQRTIAPIDLLVKKAWEPGSHWTAYVGAGPTVSIDVEEHGTHAYPGGSVVGGIYVWLSDAVGLDLEIDYALLAEHGVAQELQVAVGPMVRF